MPEIDAQARLRLREEAARMTLADASVSELIAAAAGVVAVGSPLPAALLGIGAGAIGVCGQYRMSLFAGFPRGDFAQVQITRARIREESVPAEPLARTLRLFAAQHWTLSDAFFALLRSLARHDGAVAANSDAASTQAEAVRQNASIAVGIQSSVRSLLPAMNDACNALRQAAGLHFNDMALQDVQQFYRQLWGEPPLAPGTAFTDLAASVEGTAEDLLDSFDPRGAHPILTASTLPAEPFRLIGDDYATNLASLSSALQALVVDG